MSFNPIAGDSGGPVFYMWDSDSVIALGTHVHSDPGGSNADGDGWYSPIDVGSDYYVEDLDDPSWDYRICYTASCG